jgi:hypothetical protein
MLLDDQTDEDEMMEWACGTYRWRGQRIAYMFWWGNLNRRANMEDSCLYGRIL